MLVVSLALPTAMKCALHCQLSASPGCLSDLISHLADVNHKSTILLATKLDLQVAWVLMSTSYSPITPKWSQLDVSWFPVILRSSLRLMSGDDSRVSACNSGPLAAQNSIILTIQCGSNHHPSLLLIGYHLPLTICKTSLTISDHCR